MNNKKIIGFVGILLIASAITFGFLYYKERQQRISAEAISEQVIEKVREKAIEEKGKAIDSIKMRNSTIIDSLATLYVEIQKKNKLNIIYYEKKLKKVKSINTYARRSAYADSIERTIQRQLGIFE